MAPFAKRAIQIAKETTWGTAVVAVTRIMGLLDITCEEDDTIVRVPEQGRLVPSNLVDNLQQFYKGTITLQASYEDIAFLFEGIFGTVTPGASTTYLRTYATTTAAGGTPIFYTLEYGNTGEGYAIRGVLFTKLTIGWKQGEFWTASVDYLAHSLITNVPAALADRTVNLMSGCSLAVDPYGGTIGATLWAASIFSFQYVIDTKRHLKFFGGAVAQAYGDDVWDVTLQFESEFNALSKALIDATIGAALVQKAIRLKPGNQTAALLCLLNFTGSLQGPARWGNRNGNKTVQLNWLGTLSAADLASGPATIALTNSTATVPY